jgi:hypothetical protein
MNAIEKIKSKYGDYEKAGQFFNETGSSHVSRTLFHGHQTHFALLAKPRG